MRLYTLSAAAKINLYLEIIGDRPDGYHELVMVMQSVELADRITVRSLNTPDIRLRCDHPQVPSDPSNLAFKAAALLQNRFPAAAKQYGGVEITIEKHIPVGAGLAGGSTDAAAVLVGLDMLWELGLTQIELQTLGEELGSDVPFCIAGGTAIATGRGEQVDSLHGIEGVCAVLAKYQSLSVSTPWAYQTYRQKFESTYGNVNAESQQRHEALKSGPMVNAIFQQDGVEIGRHLYNDLEKVILPEYARVRTLKETMTDCGGLGTLMSGSGPTIFTLTNDRAAAETIAGRVRSRLSDPDLQVWVTPFTTTGVQLMAS